jgi:hypothetical protein
VTLPGEVEAVLDRLPERDLTPSEARSAATALGASGVSRLTYETDSGDVRVLITALWWDLDPEGVIGTLRWDGEEHELDALARGSHSRFLDAVDSVGERFGVDRGAGEVLRLSDDGEVIDRFERDL